MSEILNCHPFQSQGSSQLGRLIKALQASAFQLDERTTQDMIAEAYRFAQSLKFFDETDTQPILYPEADKEKKQGKPVFWDRFWEVETITFLAIVAATDTEDLKRQYYSLSERITTTQSPFVNNEDKKGKEIYLPLLAYLQQLAVSLDEVYTKLVLIKHPLQSLLLNRIRRDNCCDQEELEGALIKLIGYHKGTSRATLKASYNIFYEKKSYWGIKNEFEYDAIRANPHFSIEDLYKIFHTFFQTWIVLKNAAQAGFDAELAKMELPEEVEYRIVQPHIVLFLVFLRLFRYAKESLNGLVIRHLDFCYEEILGMKRRGEVSDEAFLLFELAKDFDQHFLEKGTLFQGGKDKNGQPILYETIEDWVLRAAQVAEIKNTWIDAEGGGIHGNPDVKKRYLEGSELPNESAQQWRTLGDDENLPDAELGFAIASPQLILREGKRFIDVSIAVGNSLSDAELKLFIPENFQLFLSSSDVWINPRPESGINLDIELNASKNFPNLELASFDLDFSNQNIRIRILLEKDDPSVSALGEKLAGEAGFDTNWPILKLLIASKHQNGNTQGATRSVDIFEVFRKIQPKSIQIKVGAFDIRENLIIQTDQGVFDGTQKVFPFGPVPEIGNKCYIGSTEVFQKSLDSLQLNFDWIGAPKSFSTHYQEYNLINRNLFPIPSPKVLIDFIDRAENKLILIKQVIRQGALPNLSAKIRVKISDVHFNTEVMDKISIASTPDGAKITPVPNSIGYYDISLPPSVKSLSEDVTIILSKPTNEDFEPLSIKLNDPLIPAQVEVVMFKREKIFEAFSKVKKISGRVSNLYNEVIDNVTIDGEVLTHVNGFYQSSKETIPNPLKILLPGSTTENLSFDSKGFSILDAVLYNSDFKIVPGNSDAIIEKLSGVIQEFRNRQNRLDEVYIVAKKNNDVIAITKSTSNGQYSFPNVAGVTSIEFFYAENQQDKITKSDLLSSNLNATLKPPRINLQHREGNIDINCRITNLLGAPVKTIKFKINNGPENEIQPNHTQPNIDPEALFEFSELGYQNIKVQADYNTRFELIMLPEGPLPEPLATAGGANAAVEIKFLNLTLPNPDFLILSPASAKLSFSQDFAVITGVKDRDDITMRGAGFEDYQLKDIKLGNRYEIVLKPIKFKEILNSKGEKGIIKGKVLNLRGEAFPNVKVIASNASQYYEGSTDSNGEFKIYVQESTTYNISALFTGLDGKIQEVSNDSFSGQAGKNYSILLGYIKKSRPSDGTVKGIVTDVDGNPLEGVKIESGVGLTFSNQTGAYEIEYTKQLKFSHPLFEALTVELRDNSEVNVTMFPLEGGYWVFEGQVSDILGEKLPKVSIKAINESSKIGIIEHRFLLGTSDANGHYRISVPNNQLDPIQRIVFELEGFNDVKFDFPPNAVQGTQATISLMDVRMSYSEINLTPLVANDVMQEKFDVKINALNLVRDVRTQEFEKYNFLLKRGFVQLTLQESDFLHMIYPKMLTWYSLYAAGELNLDLDGNGIKTKVSTPPEPPMPNPPYTPATNNISLNYISTQVISGDENVDKNGNPIDQFFHILPFNGHKAIPIEPEKLKLQLVYPYLPDDTAEVSTKFTPGNLFLGISNLQPGSNLALLFEVAPGSAPDPEADLPKIHWSYLTTNNQWKHLTFDKIIQDQTFHLTRSGIIQFAIPTDAVKENTMLNPAYFWLRAAAIGNARSLGALPDMKSIRAQVIQVKFKNTNNELSHLAQPLPSGTISNLLESRTAVKKIEQPLESFAGRLPESVGYDYYIRVSERLRHKDRAVTTWDYEKLLLQQFDLVAIAKCIPHTRYKPLDGASELAPGHISVAVIPQLKISKGGPWPEPRFSQGELNDMRVFLTTRSNLFVGFGEVAQARLQIVNPLYEKVDVKVEVALVDPKLDKVFFQKQLKTELEHYISPWLADSSKAPFFGRKLQRSSILQFIEERTYVDYVEVESFEISMLKLDVAGQSINPERLIILESICPSTARSILVKGNIEVSLIENTTQVASGKTASKQKSKK